MRGEEPRIWPAAMHALSAQNNGSSGEVPGSHIPSSLREERLKLSDSGAEGTARTTGEVQFGSAEYADGRMDSFPVLGVAVAPTDESATLLLLSFS